MGLRARWAAMLLPLPILLVVGAGCRRGPAEQQGGTGDLTTTVGPGDSSVMTLSSLDFEDGAPIPRRHAYRGEGDNIPPRLSWSKLPAGTRQLALIVDDPDAPTPEPWVHDVLYAIPPDTTPDGMVIRDAAADSMAIFVPGKNSWDEEGWGGPMPPPGKAHRYVFTLYALDTELALPRGRTKDQILAAMRGHVLGTAKLVGTYQR